VLLHDLLFSSFLIATCHSKIDSKHAFSCYWIFSVICITSNWLYVHLLDFIKTKVTSITLPLPYIRMTYQWTAKINFVMISHKGFTKVYAPTVTYGLLLFFYAESCKDFWWGEEERTNHNI
jgi:hypothetical protein